MRVLLTGGAGYLGCVAAGHLVKSGHDVTVLDRFLYGGKGLLGMLALDEITLVRGDIRNRNDVQSALEDVDVVIHLAALVGDAACDVDAGATDSINRGGTMNLLNEFIVSNAERFLFLGTCSSYGVTDSSQIADETTAVMPTSLYAQTKLDGEAMVLKTSTQAVTCVLRMATICGLSPRMRFDLLLNETAQRAALGKEIELYNSKAWRPLVHIQDAVRAIALCLEAPEDKIRGESFNVVGENIQKRDLAEMVLKRFPNTSISVADGGGDLRDYRVSGKRIADTLGFEPTKPVSEAFDAIATAVRDGVFEQPEAARYRSLPSLEDIVS